MEKKFTVNVAKSRLSVGYTQNDQNLLNLWDKKEVFFHTNQQLKESNPNVKPFVLLDGPPYANGEAHLGHGLNKLLKDLVVKSRWFMGQEVRYQPGWDCHGLPLELAVEKKYGKLSPDLLKKRCKSLAFRSLVKQRKSFKRLGVLGDWNTPYVTLSQSMLEQGWRTLSHLVEKNLLQYKQFPVHYCPACASSLAEAELENKLLTKDSLYFKMLLMKKNTHVEDDGDLPTYALVWTTTPWTLPMNQGLVFHQDLHYSLWSNGKENLYTQDTVEEDVKTWLTENKYSFLKEVSGHYFMSFEAVSPLTKKTVPLLHGHFVESGKTGFVHMACAHGPEDYELGQLHNVQPHSYLNKYGVFCMESMADSNLYSLNSKKYTQVAKDVCVLLEEDLVYYSHSQTEQQVCWRHKCGVYYNATWQVFLELEHPQHNLKNKVKLALENSELSSNYQERLEQMLLGRKHWCLSRQRQWGCPMNLLVNKSDNTLSNLSSQYLSLLAANSLEQAKVLLESHPEVSVFTDVVDVWFDSGNVVNEYVYQHGAVNSQYAVDLVLEGKDQFRGWFQSLLWLCVANNDVMPYKNLLSHGFVLNEKREKFSKSTGNGKVVEYYADLYGADVLHLWTASQEPEMDAVFSESKLEEMKKYYSRLRLSLRFMTSNLYDYDYENHDHYLKQYENNEEFDVHRYLLKEMGQLYKQCVSFFEKYQFKKGLDALYYFCDKTLSNFYFELVKNNLYLRAKDSNERLCTQAGLYEVLKNLFDLVKVYCPFVAEEFYQDFYSHSTKDCHSVFSQQHLVKHCDYYLTYNVQFNWNKLQEYRKLVQSSLEPYQKSKALKSRTEAKVDLLLNSYECDHLEKVSLHFKLSDVLGVSQVNVHRKDTESTQVEVFDLKTDSEFVKCERCWNYERVLSFEHNLCLYCNNDNCHC